MCDEDSEITIEMWVSKSQSTFTVFPVGSDVEAMKASNALEYDAEFICTFTAPDVDKAMQKYYDFQGWGRYKPFEEELI